MAKISLQWHQIASSDKIRRSSQTIAVNDETLSIFGGEIVPREPVDNRVYSLSLTQPNATISIQDESSLAPPPRVGSASTTLKGKTYLFSGRGGVDMAPVSENGNLWCYDHADKTWSSISPAGMLIDSPSTQYNFDIDEFLAIYCLWIDRNLSTSLSYQNPSNAYPEARSYHSMTTDGRDAIYLHAGCPKIDRLNDLWAFQISTKKWIRLAPAPGNGMGGTSITFCPTADCLYRMNGFDGTSECGGEINLYHPEMDFWSTKSFKADGINGPEARSVSALLCILIAQKCYIITLFGEHDPSSLGHAGAGKMLQNIWAWDTEDGIWYEVSQEGRGEESPAPRGWFAAQKYGDDSIVVHGGLAEDNSRLGDVWIGKLSVAS